MFRWKKSHGGTQSLDYSNVPVVPFVDLFEPGTVTPHQAVGQAYEVRGPEGHRVTGFVLQRGGDGGPKGHIPSFYAHPTARLVQLAGDRTLVIQYDTIYFEAIHFADEVRLYAKNNQILNSGPPIVRVPLAEWPTV